MHFDDFSLTAFCSSLTFFALSLRLFFGRLAYARATYLMIYALIFFCVIAPVASIVRVTFNFVFDLNSALALVLTSLGLQLLCIWAAQFFSFGPAPKT
ncbi:hypothetical protein [Neopusillimonas maritima]|uniref:Uncharacterized protein n=1 Tax=Neopusillimonas maritima TaxID=2026239 RepID=A0A3A1YSE1_9BURK|nr:hypothetical protein [Neopusillimonas maritima]RIY41153.1 hypothetical protein CJP73_08390 [Neopusillimonas maritima]